MMGNPNQPVFILREGTERIKGRPAMSANINAAKAVSEAVRTTLGPLGMDKMLVQGGSEEILITNDGATILREIDIEHPCAKLIIEVSKSQEQECFDGTTSAVILTGALLEGSEDLLASQLHPTVICRGFREAEKLVQEHLTRTTVAGDMGWVCTDKELHNVAKTALTGKSAEGAADILSQIVYDAIDAVKEDEDRANGVNLDYIKVLSFEGGTSQESRLEAGVVLEREKLHSEMPDFVTDASVLLLTTALDVKDIKFDSQLSITDPAQISGFLEREENTLKDLAASIAVHGVTAVFCSGEIDDLCVHYLSKLGIVGFKRVKKSDLTALARLTGAKLMSNVDEIEPEDLGRADNVDAIQYGEHHCTVVKSDQARSVTVCLRGATDHSTAEVERAFDDALGVCSIAFTEPVVAGGGAVYAHLAQLLRKKHGASENRVSMAIEAYADALESIPRTLAENAGLDPVDAMFDLRKVARDSHRHGISTEGDVIDMAEAGVIEPMKVVSNAIGCATESAIMVLRIDDVILSKGAKGVETGFEMGAMG